MYLGHGRLNGLPGLPVHRREYKNLLPRCYYKNTPAHCQDRARKCGTVAMQRGSQEVRLQGQQAVCSGCRYLQSSICSWFPFRRMMMICYAV